MPSTALGTALSEIRRLYTEGVAAALPDDQLLSQFATARDEASFEALVGRHGPMVLGVCRSILKDEHSAEDAFQATFLTLARNARAISPSGALGGWLHRVAYRIALQAYGDHRRRRAKESDAAAAGLRRTNGPWDDWIPILHEEIDRLPSIHRTPIVLCYLENLTYEQAAHSLGWTEPTLRSRLVKARDQLRFRLKRRGIVGVTLVAPIVPTPSVSTACLRATVAAVTNGACGGVASTAAVALSVRMFRRTLLARLKLAGALGVVVASMATVFTSTGQSVDGPPAAESPAAVPKGVPKKVQIDAESGETIRIPGRVVDRDGRPVAGAAIQLSAVERMLVAQLGEAAVHAKSDANGRFSLMASRSIFAGGLREAHLDLVRICAVAPGHGVAWVTFHSPADLRDDLTIRFVADDLPIEGRLVDLEGRPIADALIKTLGIGVPPSGSLDRWVEGIRNHTQGPTDNLDDLRLDLTTKTARDGRFRLEGIGRERLVLISVTGPTIASVSIIAMTKDVATVRAEKTYSTGRSLTFHGARFDIVAVPGRTLHGVVRDPASGKVLSGVRVFGHPIDENGSNYSGPTLYSGSESHSDVHGSYRLTGLPRVNRYRVSAAPGRGIPYPGASLEVSASRVETETIKADIELKRGVIIRGRLIERATGKPVSAFIDYLTPKENPHVGEYPNFGTGVASTVVAGDGRFELAGLPGPGILLGRSLSGGYRLGIDPQAIARLAKREWLPIPFPFSQSDGYDVIAEVNPAPGVESITCNLELEPGRVLKGRVVDPDGKPIAGVRARGLRLVGERERSKLESASFDVIALDVATGPRRIEFFHDARQLAGSVFLHGDERGPITVTLQPWGVLTGRVVDDEGLPQPNLTLVESRRGMRDRTHAPLPESLVDHDGRFRIPVVPGLLYEANAVSATGFGLGQAFKDVKVGPGEVKDLGDVEAKQLAVKLR
jgi:RNA polymerase sigma factor (sigma-70 family)